MAYLPTLSSIKSIFVNLCMPSKIYLVISVIALLIATFTSFTIVTILAKIVFIVLWTFILNWICKKGYTTVSWGLVVVPYVLLAIMFFLGNQPTDITVDKSDDKDISNNSVEHPTIIEQPSSIILQPQPPQTQPSLTESDILSKQNRQYLAY